MNREYQTVVAIEAQRWDDFACANGGHLLQSWGWGELKSRFGWSAERILLTRDREPVAGAQMLFRRLPLGLTLAYVPRGPVCDPLDREKLIALKDAMSQVARKHRAFALKVEPNWTKAPAALTEGVRAAAPSLEAASSVKTGGFQPHTTIHVDLTRELDVILAQMKPKWRYNIRLAERRGVTVREGTVEDLDVFYRLMQVTGERDHFAVHSSEYYAAAFDLLGEQARLFLAEYQGEVLAGIFVTAFAGEAVYLYGASGNSHRERMPNHALHWQAIQWAKVRGCTRYDLWGVPDVQAQGGENGHALPDGLYQFKQGFGGNVVRYAGAFDTVFSRVKYVVYERALAMRRAS